MAEFADSLEGKSLRLGSALPRVGLVWHGAQARQQRVLDSVKYLVDNLERVPVLMFVLSAKPVPSRVLGDRASGYYGSIFPIAWSLQLALRSRGLGSVLATAIVYHAERLSELLALPEGTHPITMIPIAYTRGLDFRPAARRPLGGDPSLGALGSRRPALTSAAHV